MNRPHSNTWTLIDTGPSDAYTNMALDEVFLKGLKAADAVPILRFYTWSQPSISVGYFQDVGQDFDLALCQERRWPVVRRLTGGRAVFHDHELTYSILLPLSDPGVPSGLLESYRYLSLGFLSGLRELGADAELVSRERMKSVREARALRSPDCFASLSWYEISVGGKKIAGSAQRRTPYGILQQGSILISRRRFQEYYEVLRRDLEREGGRRRGSETPGMTSLVEILGRAIPLGRMKDAILKAFEETHQIRFVEKELGLDDRRRAHELVGARYGRNDWNFSRKPPVFKGET